MSEEIQDLPGTRDEALQEINRQLLQLIMSTHPRNGAFFKTIKNVATMGEKFAIPPEKRKNVIHIQDWLVARGKVDV